MAAPPTGDGDHRTRGPRGKDLSGVVRRHHDPGIYTVTFEIEVQDRQLGTLRRATADLKDAKAPIDELG